MLLNELAETLSVDGTWQFSFGPEMTRGEIYSPGCWEAQGYAKLIDGPARYRRVVHIPEEWSGKQIWLEFDAVSYACTIEWNGVEVGRHIGLWTPFAVDVSGVARPGEQNVLELEIWKPGERYPMRASLAGFLPDVATTFGGLWQAARLRAFSCALSDVTVQTDYARRVTHVHAWGEWYAKAPEHPYWSIEVYQDGEKVLARECPYSPGEPVDTSLALPEALLWSPESPNLYTVQVSLMDGSTAQARFSRRVGFRQLSTEGSQLLLNGKPFMVRGILSWGWVPERIAPTYTREQAREEMRRVREMGFNLIKLCLVIPSPEYFDVADEEGMLLWEELPMWLPVVTAEMRAQAPREYAEISHMLSHHPSIVLYSLGCELSQAVDSTLIDQLNIAVRERVSDVLVCDNSGSGESYGGLDFDFADFTDYHPYYDLQFFEPLLDNWRRDWQTPRPWIFGEFCDSDTFRDLTEIIHANGCARPWWLTRDNPVTTWRSEPKAVLDWEERLAAAQPGFSLQELVRISLNQSFAIRKYTLEALRRRRGMGGYIVTGLRDTPISTSGIWDDFGRPKWTPEIFHQINGEAILSLDVVRRRQWRFGGDRPDKVDPYNAWGGDRASWFVILSDTGAGFPRGSTFSWSLAESTGNVLASGRQELKQDISPGIPVQVGSIHVELPFVNHAAQLRLDASLVSGGRQVRNQWPVWVYPRPADLPTGLGIYDPSGLLADPGDWLTQIPLVKGDALLPKDTAVLIATALDDPIWEFIREGGRVLLLQPGEAPLPVRRCPFWRESINLFPQHVLWQRFAQPDFANLQFFGLASDLAFDTPGLLEALPHDAVMRPVLRRLDAREFHISEYLFEAVVGRGLLVGCVLRLQGGSGAQPFGWSRNVAGGAMLHGLLHYLTQAGRAEMVTGL